MGSVQDSNSKDTTNSVSFDSLVRATQQTNDALKLEADVQKADKKDESHHRWAVRFAVMAIVVGIVAYFASGIYSQRMRYPQMFRWYNEMKKKGPVPQGTHDFGMYQVTTAATFVPAQNMMELLLVWKHLRFESAQFLMLCIEHFQIVEQSDPKAKLTSIHWAGSAEQTHYDKLVGKDGWASAGCATGTLDQKQQTLVSNWNKGKGTNPWYYLLPQPVNETGRQAFLSVPMIKELYSDSSVTGGAVSACDESTFFDSKIGMLFQGGLCHVAFMETSSSVSADDMFNEYFASHVSVRPSCSGAYAAGATQGAMSMGSMGLMAMGMFPEITFPVVVAAAALSVAGGVAGAITSGNAAKEDCQEKQEETYGSQ